MSDDWGTDDTCNVKSWYSSASFVPPYTTTACGISNHFNLKLNIKNEGRRERVFAFHNADDLEVSWLTVRAYFFLEIGIRERARGAPSSSTLYDSNSKVDEL